MLSEIQIWGVLLRCAVAVDKVVLVGQQQAGTGSGTENGTHRRVHTMVLVSLHTQQEHPVTEQLP